MKAAVVTAYGAPDVVRVEDVADPTIGRSDVLVRVHATAVTAGDARIRGARFPRGFAAPARLAFGLRRPRRPVLGGVVSGVVEATGRDVAGLAVGDEVAAMTGLAMGCHAELVVVPSRRLVPKPAAVTHDQAAGVLFGGTTALHYVRTLGEVAAGQRVLVNGGSGAVGTNAIQLAARAGAEVTAVTSERNADLVRSLGASHVVDHTRTSLDAVEETYDVVLDAVGNVSIRDGRRLLRPGGRLLLAVASLGQTIAARGNVRAGSSGEDPDDFTALLDLVAAGDLKVVNSHELDLADIVRAHEIVDSGRKVGNVVLRP